jgi:hypothetical protein
MYKFKVGDMIQFTEEGVEYLRSKQFHLNKEYDMENNAYEIMAVGRDKDYPYRIAHPVYDDGMVFTENEIELCIGQMQLPFKAFRKVKYGKI